MINRKSDVRMSTSINFAILIDENMRKKQEGREISLVFQ